MAVARYYNYDLGEWELLAAGRDGESGASSWDDLTDKPATFPPETHTHSQSEVEGLEDFVTTVITALEVNLPDFVTTLVSSLIEDKLPIIVSSLPAEPLPGRIYFVREE